MVFLVPMMIVLYALAGVWQFTLLLNHAMRQLLSFFVALHPAKTPLSTRRGAELHRRRLAGVDA
jgi:hypothetical protein